jgi:hypothetical protein
MQKLSRGTQSQDKILPQDPLNTKSSKSILFKDSIFNYNMHKEILIIFMCAFVHTRTFIHKAI